MATKKEGYLDPRDHFIIDTKTKSAPQGRDFEYCDYDANPAYREIKEKAKDGRLAKEHPHVKPELCAKAENFHTMDHLTEEVFKYWTDENGLLWIPSHDVEVAQKLLKQLQTIDREVTVSSFGMPIPDPVEKQTAMSPRRRLVDKIRNS